MSDSGYLLDSNVWIALAFDAHPGRVVAQEAFARITADRPAVYCRATQISFLRLASTPAILRAYGVADWTNRDALDLRTQFQSATNVVFREEPDNLITLWHRLADRPTASPRVWMDAYLAAFAIAGGLTLLTLDRDFAAIIHDDFDCQILQPA